jgi:hypothetical protein
MTPKTADELLMEARALLPRRPPPSQALAVQANGALLVDIRSEVTPGRSGQAKQ